MTGRPGDVFKVVITDDLRSVWSLFDAAAAAGSAAAQTSLGPTNRNAGGNLSILMQIVPGFAIGGVGRSRYHFMVPEGTREFRVKIRAGHHGPYAGVVIAPSGRIAGFHQGVNLDSTAPVSGGAKAKTAAANEHPDRGVITVNPDPRETGKVWSLVLTGRRRHLLPTGGRTALSVTYGRRLAAERTAIVNHPPVA